MAIPRVFMETNIYLPPVLKELDQESFWLYTEWQEGRKELSGEIIKKFKGTLGASTGFSDENPPEKPTEKKIECGSIMFRVESREKTKRPKYREIYHEFKDYLNWLQKSYEEKTLKKGYRTIEVEPGRWEVYISLEMLLEKLKKDVETMVSEREGVEHSIELMKPRKLTKLVPKVLTIVWGTDYGAMTEYNARMFQEAVNMKEEGDINTGFSSKKEARDRFKKILLEDSFNRIRGKPVEGEYVKIPYPFEGIKFLHGIKPEATVKYESIIDAFLKPVPDKLRKGAKIGDLIMAESLLTPGLPERLKENGIWDDKFEATYRPIIENEEVYIPLSGPLQRLEQYKKEFTHITYNQHVSVGRR